MVAHFLSVRSQEGWIVDAGLAVDEVFERPLINLCSAGPRGLHMTLAEQVFADTGPEAADLPETRSIPVDVFPPVCILIHLVVLDAVNVGSPRAPKLNENIQLPAFHGSSLSI